MVLILTSGLRKNLENMVTTPWHQPLYLLPICRLGTILEESNKQSVICNLQEFNSWVLGGAVISIEGEEQWGRGPIPGGHQC